MQSVQVFFLTSLFQIQQLLKILCLLKILFVKSLVFANSRYLFCLNKNGTILMREVDVYLSPDLYNNNKPFLKNIQETSEVTIDSNVLSYIRRQLSDPTYTI